MKALFLVLVVASAGVSYREARRATEDWRRLGWITWTVYCVLVAVLIGASYP